MTYSSKLFVLILILFVSCSKNNLKKEPVVIINKPTVNQEFSLPDTISVNFNIQHNQSIEYIRVSIDNENIIPISDQRFIYPDKNDSIFNITFAVKPIPENSTSSIYYTHIVISDFNDTYHYYQNIELRNNGLSYKGFILTTQLINNIEFSYYNELSIKQYSKQIDGLYSDTEISNNSDLYCVATKIPELISSFEIKTGDLKWQRLPQLPYPEFTNLQAYSSNLYISTSIGRIIGLKESDGVQIFTTPVLMDSIPQKICFTENYLFSNFKLRNSGNNVWVSFHKQTGGNNSRYPNDYLTIDIFYYENNNILIFANQGNTGTIIDFDVESNNIDNNYNVGNNKIDISHEIDKNNYLFTDNKNVFSFSYTDKSISMIYESSDSIIDLKYEPTNQTLFIASLKQIDVITYPDFNHLKSINSTNNIKSIELVYSN